MRSIETQSRENCRDVTSMVRIKVQGRFHNVLLDSGSNLCCVSKDFSQKLGLKIKPLEGGDTKRVMTANYNGKKS